LQLPLLDTEATPTTAPALRHQRLDAFSRASQNPLDGFRETEQHSP
jgi:hypothetical protein